ncbi:hypothetical protein NX786_09985 [Telluria mixta]|uniref:GIY-YIG domain-containing protein n=1 Tax=Telluria mixta TaxID=34071 RepID=A0ABT2BX94_9BURK|nr:hypothetical protein [Telluria mixta]MCS0629661.1 hypothetical protein [Telluria mixta]WEM96770.1 hypothetical protein P0M04_03215 [Telluria mixta]
MDRLLQIGFRDIGCWTLAGDTLQLQLDTLPTHRRALYAFATESAVLYVGKTAGSLPMRLKGYIAPHQSQRTNVRNHAALCDLLSTGTKVRILGWIDPGLHRIGPFDLNMAAGLEDSIIALLAPPWNGTSTTALRVISPDMLSQALQAPPASLTPIASTPAPLAQAVAPLIVNAQVAPTTLLSNPAILSAPSNTSTSSFKVKLGKTYYERGFFNVPVAFSQLFGAHGATVELYCGDERACLHAVLDRKANQQSGTPRIYGKSELACWFQRRFQLDDTLKITVLGPTSAILI